jgi:hypothetical protein
VYVELALNLVCLLITCGSLLAWTLWRRRSDSDLVPELGRGVLILALMLMIFLPAISITDDLAQAPALAEGVRLQDVLKAPEHVTQFVVSIILLVSFFCLGKVVLWREADIAQGLLHNLFDWNPNVEKRPPPSPSFSFSV